MNIVKAIKSDIIKKKLPNGLFEVKQESTDTNIKAHWFEDENGILQGQYMMWWDNGSLYKCYFLKDNLIHGEYKMWSSTEKLILHKIYYYGKVIENIL